MSFITPKSGWDDSANPRRQEYVYDLSGGQQSNFFGCLGKAVLFGIIGFIALLIVWRLVHGNRSVSTAAETESAATISDEPIRHSQPARPARHFYIGDEVTVGYWTYQVKRAFWSPVIIGDFFSTHRADASYLIVLIEAHNNDNSASHFDLPQLIDSRGNTFDETVNAGYLEVI